MTSKERIEKEAWDSTVKNFNTSDIETNPHFKGYVRGATAEQERFERWKKELIADFNRIKGSWSHTQIIKRLDENK